MARAVMLAFVVCLPTVVTCTSQTRAEGRYYNTNNDSDCSGSFSSCLRMKSIPPIITTSELFPWSLGYAIVRYAVLLVANLVLQTHARRLMSMGAKPITLQSSNPQNSQGLEASRTTAGLNKLFNRAQALQARAHILDPAALHKESKGSCSQCDSPPQGEKVVKSTGSSWFGELGSKFRLEVLELVCINMSLIT